MWVNPQQTTGLASLIGQLTRRGVERREGRVLSTCMSTRAGRREMYEIFLPTMVEFARRIYQLELYMLSVPSLSCCSLLLNARKTVRTLFTSQICLMLLYFSLSLFFNDKPLGFAVFRVVFCFTFVKDIYL